MFFLANTLQVDLAFAPADHFGALAPTFRLIFGTAKEQQPKPRRDADNLIGWAWLYALHVRSSLARGRLWQAEYMISGMRRSGAGAGVLRYDLPMSEGRGFDDLPSKSLLAIRGFAGFAGSPASISSLFVVIEALIGETLEVDSRTSRTTGRSTARASRLEGSETRVAQIGVPAYLGGAAARGPGKPRRTSTNVSPRQASTTPRPKILAAIGRALR